MVEVRATVYLRVGEAIRDEMMEVVTRATLLERANCVRPLPSIFFFFFKNSSRVKNYKTQTGVLKATFP